MSNIITDIVKFSLASLFMIAIYLLFPIAIKLYVDWLVDFNIFLIILITIFALTITRLILNRIPYIIVKLITNKSTMLRLVKILHWVLRTLYLFFIILNVDIDNTKSIIIWIFSYLLFYLLSNFFAQGIFKYLMIQVIQEDNEDDDLNWIEDSN